MPRTLIALLVGLTLALPSAASAATLTIVPPPAPQRFTVQGPADRLTVLSLPHVRVGSAIPAEIEYSLQVARRLVVVAAQGATCEATPAELLRTRGNYQELADLREVTGGGALRVAALADHWGEFVVCAYLFGPNAPDDAPAQSVVASNSIRAGAAARRCAQVSGPRGITGVRAGGVSCTRARSVARRWGAARHPPRRVSNFDCGRVAGRRVSCTYGVNDIEYGEVTFRYRR